MWERLIYTLLQYLNKAQSAKWRKHMGKLGISIYPERSTFEKDKAYLDLAHQYGFKRVFTSLLEINGDKDEVLAGFKKPVDYANSLGMEVSKKILLLALGVDNVCIISLSTDSGTVYIYTVSDITIYENTADLSLPVMDGKTFVLVTCYPFRYSGHAPGKCVVTARRIGRKQVIAALHLCDFACE